MRALGLFTMLTATIAVVTISSTAFAEDDQPPLWSLLDTYDAVEDVPVTYDMADSIYDPDTPVENLSVESGSPFVENITGMLVTFLFPNGVLEANVTIRVSDGNATVGAVLHFLVEPVNDPPRFEPRHERLPDGEWYTYYSFNLTAIDVDNSPEELTYSTDATFFTMSRGEIAFTPLSDMGGHHWFNVTVTDPGDLYDTMQLVLFIISDPDWNDRNIPPQVLQVDQEWVLDISQYLDYPNGNTPPDDRFTFTYSDDSSKIETDPVTGVVTWTPTNEDVGDHFFTITKTDGEGRADQQEIKVTVEDPGPGPDPIIPAQHLTQGVRYVFQVPINPWYDDHPACCEEMEFDNEPNDLFRVDPYTGIIDFAPGNEDVGVWEVDIIVTDSFGLKSTRTVIFQVKNVNDPPVLGTMGVQFLTEGESTTIELIAQDPDQDPRRIDPKDVVDPNEVLTFSGGPPGASVDARTGILEFVPDQGHVSASPMIVTFAVEDAGGEKDIISVEFHVEDVVLNPWVQIIGVVEGQKVGPGNRVKLVATSKDESGGPWADTYEWYRGSVLIGHGPEITWVPENTGPKELTLVASNEDGVEASLSVNITVKWPTGRHSTRDTLICMTTGILVIFTAAVVTLRLVRLKSWPRGRRDQN